MDKYKYFYGIIKEELNIFLNENIADDEIVNFDDISLQKEYNKINAELFNNDLPEVPLVWSKRKKALGHVKGTHNRNTGQQKVIHLAMSTFFEVAYRIFKNTLAHEMIHVKQISDNTHDNWDTHGWKFMEEARRINNMGLGYSITKTNGEDLKVSAKLQQRKTRLIAIILEMHGEYSISVTTPKVYEEQKEQITGMFRRGVQAGRMKEVELTFIESTNPELLKYTIQRSYGRSFKHRPLEERLFNDLIEENIIDTVKYSNDMNEAFDEKIFYIT